MSSNDELNEYWQYVLSRQEKLTRLCYQICRDEFRAEELFSDEVLRMLPGCFLRWDRTRSLDSYVFSYMRFHIRKVVYYRRKKEEQLDEIHTDNEYTMDDGLQNLEVEDTVQKLLEVLGDEARLIVTYNICLGMTYREVGHEIGRSHTYVSKVLTRSLAKLREHGIEDL